MASLVTAPTLAPSRILPPHLQQLIVPRKAEYADLRVHEVATICYARTGVVPVPILSSAVLPRNHRCSASSLLMRSRRRDRGWRRGEQSIKGGDLRAVPHQADQVARLEARA